jgi:SAM-dependent methyltransferase
MLDKILPYTCCPLCSTAPLCRKDRDIFCSSCGAAVPVRDGVLDLIGDDSSEVITPFQRIMQTPLIVSIYERLWRRAGYFLASSRSFDDEVRTVLRLHRSGEDARVLDLACGPGIFTRPLARQSKGIVVGLDLSWPMLRFAQRKIEREDLQNVILVRGSAFRLPFVTASFTSVNCCGALHLFDRPEDALEEIQRVLCPKGHLCVQTTIRPVRSAGLAYFLERFIRFGFFDEAVLREKISLLGLDILESERHRISFTFLARSDP